MVTLILRSCIVRDYDTIEVQDNFKFINSLFSILSWRLWAMLFTSLSSVHSANIYWILWCEVDLALGQRTEGTRTLLMRADRELLELYVQVVPFAFIVYFWLCGQPRHMSYTPLFGFLNFSTIDIWSLRSFCCEATTSLASIPTRC